MAVAEEKGGAPAGETYEEYLARQYAEGNVHSVPPAEQAPPPPAAAAPAYTPQEQLAYDQGQAYQSGDAYSTADGTAHPYNQQYQNVTWTGTPEEQLAYDQSQQYAMQNVHSAGPGPAQRYAWQGADSWRPPPSGLGLPSAEETVNAFARATGQPEMQIVKDGDGTPHWLPRYLDEFSRQPIWYPELPPKPEDRPPYWGDAREDGAPLLPARRVPSADDAPTVQWPNPRDPNLDSGFGPLDYWDFIREAYRRVRFEEAYQRWLRQENWRKANDPTAPPQPRPIPPPDAVFAQEA